MPSLLARKVRLLLTACLSVVLGVGFMAGTFVLTDTMTRAFNDLFDTAYSRRSTCWCEARTPSPRRPAASRNASRCPSRCSSRCRTSPAWPGPGRRRRVRADRRPGDRQGDRHVRSADGRLGMERPQRLHPQAGRVEAERARPGRDRRRDGPRARDIQVGDRVEIVFEGPPGEFDVVGIAGYGDADSLAGRRGRCSTCRPRSGCWREEGELDSVSVVADQGVSGVDLQRSDRGGAAQGRRGRHGRHGDLGVAQDQVSTGLGFLRTAFLVFAFSRPVRRRLHHLQHVRDRRGPHGRGSSRCSERWVPAGGR